MQGRLMLTVSGQDSQTGVSAPPPVEKECRGGREKFCSLLRIMACSVLDQNKKQEHACLSLVHVGYSQDNFIQPYVVLVSALLLGRVWSLE